MDIQALIGLGAAPIVIIALTAHIRGAARAMHHYLRGMRGGAEGATVWPLVADLVAVGWCWALAQDGLLQAFLHLDHITLPTIVLIGLALGIASGQIRDKVTGGSGAVPPGIENPIPSANGAASPQQGLPPAPGSR